MPLPLVGSNLSNFAIISEKRAAGWHHSSMIQTVFEWSMRITFITVWPAGLRLLGAPGFYNRLARYVTVAFWISYTLVVLLFPFQGDTEFTWWAIPIWYLAAAAFAVFVVSELQLRSGLRDRNGKLTAEAVAIQKRKR